MKTSIRALTATVMTLALLVGALAGAAVAQEAGDGIDCPDGFVPGVDDDNYPVCVEDTQVLDDDVVADDEPDVAGVVIQQPPAETVVLGRTLALTGGDLLVLLAAGVLLAGLGGFLLVSKRRRAGDHSS